MSNDKKNNKGCVQQMFEIGAHMTFMLIHFVTLLVFFPALIFTVPMHLLFTGLMDKKG